jgi:hypothetical protein
MSANGISRLQYKRDRQLAKLALAEATRQGLGYTNQYLDTTLLPTIYAENDNDTNNVIDNPNSGGLIIGRPWTAVAPEPSVPEFTNPTQTTGSAVSVVALSPFTGGGNSYQFSTSTNSYLSFPASADWAMGTGDFTVEWFSRQTSLTQFQRVFTVGDYPAIDFGVSIEGGTFYYWSGGDVDFEYSSASAVVTNTWYHFAVVRQSGTTRVYRNGVQLGSAVTNTDNINDTTTNFIVGNTNTFATNAAFVGAITNFRLVKGLAVYTGAFTVPTSALTVTASANPYGGSNTQAIPAGVTKLLLVP